MPHPLEYATNFHYEIQFSFEIANEPDLKLNDFYYSPKGESWQVIEKTRNNHGFGVMANPPPPLDADLRYWSVVLRYSGWQMPTEPKLEELVPAKEWRARKASNG